MTEGTKRTLRTALQIVFALVVAVPVAVAFLPTGTPVAAAMAAFGAYLTLFVKVYTALEDRGLIPAFLRDIDFLEPVEEDFPEGEDGLQK